MNVHLCRHRHCTAPRPPACLPDAELDEDWAQEQGRDAEDKYFGSDEG